MDYSSSDEGSPQYSYSRMNSEVIEKPSHLDYYDEQSVSSSSASGGSRCDDIDLADLLSESDDSREVIVLESSCLSPHPSHCSSKGDLDGSNASDIDGVADELDEGFDEEFENEEGKDNDLWETNITPTFDGLNDLDLNDKELQQILMEQSTIPLPNAALLEDFDLGVDVLGPEQTFNNADVPIKSPASSSPYQLGSNLSPMSVVSDMPSQQTNFNEVQLEQFYQPSTSLSDIEPFTSVSSTLSDVTFTNTQTSPSWCNPTLTSVNMLLDVIDLHEVATFVSSNLNEQTNSPYSYDTLTSAYSVPSNTQTTTIPSQPVTTHHSQTSDSARLARSLSPAPPSHTHTYQPPPAQSGACYLPPSPYSPAESAVSPVSNYSAPSNFDYSGVSFTSEQDDGEQLTSDEQKYVNMPYHKFKRLLDDETASDDVIEKLKGIRKRGKNKVAAKNCRQKKLNMVNRLQLEINQMKAAKAKLSIKSQSLELEISSLKQRCALRYNTMNSSR